MFYMSLLSRDTSFCIVTDFGLDNRGSISRREQESFLYSTASIQASGPTQLLLAAGDYAETER